MPKQQPHAIDYMVTRDGRCQAQCTCGWRGYVRHPDPDTDAELQALADAADHLSYEAGKSR